MSPEPKDARQAAKDISGVVGYNAFTTVDSYIWQRFGAKGAWIISGTALAALAVIVAWAFTG